MEKFLGKIVAFQNKKKHTERNERQSRECIQMFIIK